MGLAKGVGLIGAVVVLAAGLGAARGEAAIEGVAECRDTTFHAPEDWRSKTVRAGPVAIHRNRLRGSSRTRNGQFLAKRPLLVVPSDKSVTVSVPRRLRGRVYLYYGRWRDRDGEPTTAFRGARGYDAVEFHPCSRRTPTVWAGGLRMTGRAPVRLIVRVEDRRRPFILRLGRPSQAPPRP